MICAHCQTENLEGALFCSVCGNKLWQDAEGNTTAHITDQMDKQGFRSGWGTSNFGSSMQLVLYVNDSSEPLTLEPGAENTLGRTDESKGSFPDIDLTPYGAQDMGVSRIHAKLLRGDQVLSITDLSSANGTYLNGNKLMPDDPRVVRDGDRIQLGKLIIHVYFK